jgi:hypothetical protein
MNQKEIACCRRSHAKQLPGTDNNPFDHDISVVHSCKRLGLIDNLSAYFLPANIRSSRVSSRAVMSGTVRYHMADRKSADETLHKGGMRQDSSLQLESIVNGLPKIFTARGRRLSALSTVSKLHWDDKRSFECAEHVAKVKSVSMMCQRKSSHTARKVLKLKIKSSKKYSLFSEEKEGHDGFSEKSEQTTRKSRVDVETFHTFRQHSKKRTQVEALFDGLTQFFSIHNNTRKRNRPCSAINDLSSGLMLDNMLTNNNCLQKAAAAVSSAPCPNKIGTSNTQLKKLQDGLSHLYSVNRERKRKSRFFYAPSPVRVKRRADCIIQNKVQVPFGSENSMCNVLLKKHEVDQHISEKPNVRIRSLKKSCNECGESTRETWKQRLKEKVVKNFVLPYVDKGRFHSLQ